MFTILHTLPLPPGCCKICGGSDKEWYLDMGHSEEFWGAIYYCNECIGAVAHACGFIDPQEAQLLREEVDHLDLLLRALQTDKKDLEDGLDALLRARFVSRDVPADLPDAPVPFVAPLEFTPEGEAGQDSGDTSVGSGEGTTAEPLHVEGVGDLRSDDEFDDDFLPLRDEPSSGLSGGWDPSQRS